MASVEGKLASVGVPRLFRAIADERRTGRLGLTYSGDQEPAEAEVYFREGSAYHARVIGRGIQLGTRLISAGLLSNEDVEHALAIQQAEGRKRRLGEILVDENLISREHMETVVRQQIEDTIFEILRWEDGIWLFESNVESEEDIGLQVSVENLVMEGARRFREWHLISKIVPSLDAVPVFSDEDGAAIEVALTPEEWAFVSRVDSKSTISNLAAECGFTDLETARTVAGLVTAGLLRLRLPPGIEPPSEDEELELAFDELERALEEAAREKTGEEGHSPESLEAIVAQIGGTITDDEPGRFEVAAEVAPVDPNLVVVFEDAQLPGLDELPTVNEQEISTFQVESNWVPESRSLLEIDEAAQGVDLPLLGETEPVLEEFVEPVIEEFVEPVLEGTEDLAELPQPEAIAPQVEVSEFAEEVLESPPVEDYTPVFSESPDQKPLGGQFEQTYWPAPNGEAETTVLAEESDHSPLEITSIAQVFAELAKPFDGPDVRKMDSSAPTAFSPPEPSETSGIPVPSRSEANESKPGFKEHGPIADDVDVGALMREISALGADDEHEHLELNGTSDRPASKGKGGDKGRGLFGKRRK